MEVPFAKADDDLEDFGSPNVVKTTWEVTAQQRHYNKSKRTGTFGGSRGVYGSTRRRQQQQHCNPFDQIQEPTTIGGVLDSPGNSFENDFGFVPSSESSATLSSSSAVEVAACLSAPDSCLGTSQMQVLVPPERPSKPLRRSRSLSHHNRAPMPPKPRPIKRASTNSEPSFRSSTSYKTQSDSILFDLKENSNPNWELEETFSPPDVSSRKRLRARRNSMSSTYTRTGGSSMVLHRASSVSNLSGSSSARIMCRRNSMSTLEVTSVGLFSSSSNAATPVLDDDLSWTQALPSKGSLTPPSMADYGDFTEGAGSSPAQSVTTTGSSRKRGMSEDPSEDNDDMFTSIGGFSARRTSFANASASRSSRMLAVGQDTMPTGPPTLRYVPIGVSDEEPFRRTGRAMNIDSDGEEGSEDDEKDELEFLPNDDESTLEISECGSSPSNDSVNDNATPGLSLQIVDTEDQVLSSMPTYDDLKYLIKELKKEEKSSAMASSIGSRSNFSVNPPCTWPADRRSRFLTWASKQLGFSLRFFDPTVRFLQIPASKGIAALNLLNSALILHKRREKAIGTESQSVSKDSPFVIDTSTYMGAGQKNVVKSSVKGFNLVKDPDDSAEAVLVESLNLLSFKDKEKLLFRRVTEDDRVNAISRPSIITTMDCSPRPRQSSHAPLDESHVFGTSTDRGFVGHMQGVSPVVPTSKSSRPPRLSSSSVSSVVSKPPQQQPELAVGAQQNSFDFTTPLMKQNTCWGSRPIAGKDWGSSNRLSETKTAVLINKFNASLREAGKYDAAEDFLSCTGPPAPNTCSNLCFDLEAEDNGLSDDDDGAPMVTIEREEGMSFDLQGTNSGVEMDRDARRRTTSFAKHRRVQVCALPNRLSGIYQRKSLFERKSYQPVPKALQTLNLSVDVDAFKSCLEMDVFKPCLDMIETLPTDKQLLMETLSEKKILSKVFSFLEGPELLKTVSLVCASWADACTDAFAELMISSVGCSPEDESTDNEDSECHEEDKTLANNSIARSMERSWKYLVTNFPYASFLSEGAFKRVYKVKNSAMKAAEAISIMDVDLIESTGNKSVVATELAVSVMLSSLSRRGICPNFVTTRGVFTCPYEPPASHWGCAENKNHHVHVQSPKARRQPKEPGKKHRGRFQYIRMELCLGDTEEYIKDQPKSLLPVEMSRNLLFQICFGLFAAQTKFSLKHYDLKLLNVFLQNTANVPGAKPSATGDVVLRYGLGAKNFALRMPAENGLIAKLADYGTADVNSESNGKPLTLGQITTLENTPPEFFILGDAAKQGHGHDLFGLGLCMLHLFTGEAPYEEILADVKCPTHFKNQLRNLWEHERSQGYSVIRSVILADVYKDEFGNIIDGEPDETMYDTLYRFLVLFGVPELQFQRKKHGKVWKAIAGSFDTERPKRGKDAAQYAKDRRKYSLEYGSNTFIRRARQNLESTKGAMDLLNSLVTFDPDERATTLDVLNSDFFEPLKEAPATFYNTCDDIRSFTAFATYV